jgi:hypothetical protein
MLQAGKSGVRDPMISLNFFNLPNPSGCAMAIGFIQPLTEISITNKGKTVVNRVRPARKADNLNAICKPIV